MAKRLVPTSRVAALSARSAAQAVAARLQRGVSMRVRQARAVAPSAIKRIVVPWCRLMCVPTYLMISSRRLCLPVSLLKEVLTRLFVIIMGQTLPACDGRPRPSVQCVSADDDWYCPHGYVCGTVSGACYDFAADCTTPGAAAGGGASTATSPPSSGATSSSSSVAGSGGGSGTTSSSGGTTSPPKSAGALANDVHMRLVVTLGALVVVGVVGFIK